MTERSDYGNYVKTGATVGEVPAAKALKYFEVQEREEGFVFTRELDKADIVYGLGEQVRGINKRGWKYCSYNLDDPSITENRESLYAAHNFLLVSNPKLRFGVFFDTGDKVSFDIGYTDADRLSVNVRGGCSVYIVDGTSAREIVREFRELIGQSYIPPRWAFGYGQSRWGYKTKEDIESVEKRYSEEKMPLDMIYMDIDYMQDYKDFTVNEERFPDFKDFVASMNEKGVRLVPIIDAGVKAEENYSVYEEGIRYGYFCRSADGEPFVAGVWPGDSVFPDVLNEKAAEWFGSNYKVLLDLGIEGFWNDMNEPALFYSKESLHNAVETVSRVKGKNLALEDFQAVSGAFGSLANSEDDYKKFYHNVDGRLVSHDKVHNLFGYRMTRAAAEYFKEYDPQKRYLLFSRSSYIGMHRYGGIWTGDNASRWEHLLLNLKMMPSLNMCGFLYCGADLGGFGQDTTEDLMLRWMAFGIFTPLMRNHSSLHTRNQELYLFKAKDVFRRFLGIRYSLIPYIYSEFVKAALNNDMLFRPLAFDYPDDGRAETTEDQIMFGESLMLAPVYEQNAKGRYVYLPERMKMIRMQSYDNYREKILEKGSYYIEVPLNEIVFFLKENCVLPLAEPAVKVADVDFDRLRFVQFIHREKKYAVCDDNGGTITEKDFKYHTVFPEEKA